MVRLEQQSGRENPQQPRIPLFEINPTLLNHHLPQLNDLTPSAALTTLPFMLAAQFYLLPNPPPVMSQKQPTRRQGHFDCDSVLARAFLLVMLTA